MARLFIVIGLICIAAGVWTSGDERVVCRAALSAPGTDARPSADCSIRIRRWFGRQTAREQAALGVVDFRSFAEHHAPTDSEDSERIDWYLEMTTRDDSRYRVAAYQPEAESAVVEARRWLATGMDGEYVFVSDAFGRGIVLCLIGAGFIAGGVVGRRIGAKARESRPS